jgi:hypothetical protein
MILKSDHMKFIWFFILAGWCFFHPAFSLGQSWQEHKLSFLNAREFHRNFHSGVTYTFNAMYDANSRYRIYDPEEIQYSYFAAEVRYPIRKNLLFVSKISYSYATTVNNLNILETVPYKHDFIFLTDTTRGDFSIQNPALTFDCSWQPLTSWFLHQRISYSFGKAVKDRYTAPENTFLNLLYSISTTYTLQSDLRLSGRVWYRYAKEIIDLDEIDELPPIFLRRYRGFFKYRDYTGTLNHFEKSKQLGFSGGIHQSFESWSYDIHLTSSGQSQINYDRYLANNHDDFQSKFQEFGVYDTLQFRIRRLNRMRIFGFFREMTTRLINPLAGTLAIREKTRAFSFGVGYGRLFPTSPWIRSFVLNVSVIRMNPHYQDYLANVDVNQWDQLYHFSLEITSAKISQCWQWQPLLYVVLHSQNEFNYLYAPAFTQIGTRQTFRFQLRKQRILELAIHAAYSEKNNFQHRGFLAGIEFKFIRPWNSTGKEH